MDSTQKGALVLALMALASAAGWYLSAQDASSDAAPHRANPLTAKRLTPYNAPPVAEPEPCSITGTATVGGNADPEVRVVLTRLQAFEPVEVWRHPTGLESAFAFNDLSPGWYRVSAYAPDAVPGTARNWECVDGEGTFIELTLRAGDVEVSGTLRDPDGLPVPEATLAVSQRVHRSVLLGTALIPVDDQGRWSVRLVVGHGYQFLGNAPRYLFASQELQLEDHDVAPIELSLAPQPMVYGLAVDEVGAPVAAASVVLGPAGHVNHSATTTDDDGVFALPAHSKRPMNAGAAAGTRFGCTPVEPIEEGQDAFNIRIVMAPGRSVTGVVRHEDGTPIAGDQITWLDERCGRMGEIAVDSEGAFRAVLPMVPLKMWPHSSRLRKPVAYDDAEIELQGTRIE